MGMGARQKLSLFAKNFENKMQNLSNPNAPQRSTLEENTGAVAERRGLLDDDDGDEGEIEFEMKKKM